MKGGNLMNILLTLNKQISLNAIGFLYAFIHFTVDAACFYFLFSRLAADSMWWCLALFYDALAFIPQSFFGLLVDRFPRFNAGFAGCILVFLALIIPFDMPALIIISLGNALAHIGGAHHTLCDSNGKIAPCGIYVSGGSFGVITGQLLALAGITVTVPLTLIAISAILTLVVFAKHHPDTYEAQGFDITPNISAEVIVLLAFIAVAVRSYIGYAVPTEWNQARIHAILLYCFMGIGKAIGGILCDCVGYRKTSFISLIASLPFLLFGNRVIVLSLIGIGLFSMTMPVTVAILVSKLPKNPCFAFGITTIALFVGTFPAFFIQPQTLLGHQVVVLILSILAALCIHTSLKKGE